MMTDGEFDLLVGVAWAVRRLCDKTQITSSAELLADVMVRAIDERKAAKELENPASDLAGLVG